MFRRHLATTPSRYFRDDERGPPVDRSA
jgi:hypothetical protein